MLTACLSLGKITKIMDDKVTEIRSGIDEIRLTSKFLLKRLNRVIDDGNTECTCNCNTEPIDKDIEKLQTRIKALEERLKTTDESRLSNDLKVLVDRFDLVERNFQEETGNLKLFQRGPTVSDTATSKIKSKTKSEPNDKDKTANQKHDDTNRRKIVINDDEGDPLTADPNGQGLHKHTNGLKSKSAPPEGDNAFYRIQTEEKNDATKTKEKQKLNDDKKVKEKGLRNNEKISEIVNNKSNTGEGNKGIIKSCSNVAIRKPNFMVSKQSGIIFFLYRNRNF
ncbi:uncharacterized protein LOC132716827 [Ruditapes philippinarum]|uniref:uncharacterized protein LOC132716827 n=1 Tax=Ruditapes philippinarum TaxID=129788 RepID=UPI00295B0EE2|nr:uncharacterized protein LOC132716827 [Ruditapes philippinarum]XP_060556152.1 uncharacterized protein LOC132716827 [Ruditapes philippinarum]XP_060556153.1 uncharacterized protein LOC132716827 [Ruditapes philippinarum]XP_060556154.1 uncharacterized protein LOC132716827 [Ruditapes philippinarum]XP_060556155.1 uncharacterized protein LOC132716827 [Ruditapes philippinarum]